MGKYDDPRDETWPCVQIVSGGYYGRYTEPRPCARTANFQGGLSRLSTSQPMCWQHWDAIEKQLQFYHLGIARPLPPNVVDTRRRKFGEHCIAFMDDQGARCGKPAIHYYLHGERVDNTPFCAEHTDRLIKTFIERFDGRVAGNRSRPHWGWRLAESYGVTALRRRD